MRMFKNQRGDTILEVLIAVAVLSLILTVSFALSNRSTQGNRQAQERGEAAKHTESQIELLKTYLANTTNPVLPPTNSNFCMKNDATPTEAVVGIPSNAQSETFTSFNDSALADCKKGEFFHTYINRQGNTFTAHTRWYKVAGRGIDEATMVHRIYPEIVSGASVGGTVTVGCPVNHFMNSLGGCTICPLGHSSPGGTSTSCAPVLPRAIVNVKKVKPSAGNNTPSCSSTNVENRSGISVTLTHPGQANRSSTTDFASDATFTGLSLNSPSYTATPTAPANYQVCPPASQPVPPGGLGPSVGVGSTVGPVNFKVRPICYSVNDYGWVDRGWWYTAYWAETVYWWDHQYGGYYFPPSESRELISTNEGGYAVEYRRYGVRYMNSSSPNYQRYFYNRFVLLSGVHWHPYSAWQSNWVSEVVGSHMECPA